MDTPPTSTNPGDNSIPAVPTYELGDTRVMNLGDAANSDTSLPSSSKKTGLPSSSSSGSVSSRAAALHNALASGSPAQTNKPLRSPETDVRWARQLESDCPKYQHRKGDDVLGFINDIEATHFRTRISSMPSRLELNRSGKQKDDTEPLSIQEPMKQRSFSSQAIGNRAICRNLSTEEVKPVIPGDVMTFIADTEDSYARANISKANDEYRETIATIERFGHGKIPSGNSTVSDDNRAATEVSKKLVSNNRPPFKNPFTTAKSKIAEWEETGENSKGEYTRVAFVTARSPNSGSLVSLAQSDKLDRQRRRAASRSSVFFDDPTDPCAALDDSILEPCPVIETRKSLGEILDEPFAESDIAAGRSRASTFEIDLSMSRQGSSKAHSTYHQPSNPPAIVDSGSHAQNSAVNRSCLIRCRNSRHLNRLDSTAMIESTKSLSSHRKLCFNSSSSSSSSFGTKLPTEILHQVLSLLSPADFNSVRHVCRSWFAGSLKLSMLKTMLRRGGWSRHIPRSPTPNLPDHTRIQRDRQWVMSKKIARECALGPDWTGNGLDKNTDDVTRKTRDFLFSNASVVDFTDVASGSGPDTAGIIFTVSSCGKFLMAANGCLIYIYEINRDYHKAYDSQLNAPGYLRPFTSIICPRRVIAFSIDTSSHRYAIAALLDGRMGLVYDMSPENVRQSNDSDEPRSPSDVPIVDEADVSTINTLFNPDDESKKQKKTMPAATEPGQRSLYRNICSEDDPPRSVAICPQRRCVAFGCSSGIELHWVDALTGQDLNRWFPLTSPSDYLFFLPPRRSIDSAKKLRLISSAGKPSERSALFHRSLYGPMSNSMFWDSTVFGNDDSRTHTEILARLRGEAGARAMSGRVRSSDHYRAVPLSDGYHIIFTDPSTGLLCIGSDAPMGGPTKLLRKIWFEGPSGNGSPITYACGADLKSGLRVVAAYGLGKSQSLWFFSVPGDIFAASQTSAAVAGSPSLRPDANRNIDWMEWWDDEGLADWLLKVDPSNMNAIQMNGVLPPSVWPIKVRGQEFAQIEGVADLAIESGRYMTIWVFGKDGMATAWKIDRSGEPVKKFVVSDDGTIRELDGEGDTEMIDSPSLSTSSSVTSELLIPNVVESFDGTSSTLLSGSETYAGLGLECLHAGNTRLEVEIIGGLV